MRFSFSFLPFLVLAAVPALPASASPDAVPDVSLRPVPILVDATRWKHLPAQIAADPAARAMLDELRQRAESNLAGPPVNFVRQGRRMLAASRQLQDRALLFGLLHRLDGDPRYRDRLLMELRTAARLPDWNPSHFLDTAEMTLGFAVALDWLRADLSSEDRTLFEDAVLSKALRASLADPQGKPYNWVAGRNNWTQICHSGLVAGALVTAHRDPELARAILERAHRHVPAATAAYAPDGAYAEGSMYWNYGTIFHVILVDLLDAALGRDSGLASSPGFIASADYVLQMNTPAGGVFNYGDARQVRGAGVVTGLTAAQRARADGGFSTTLFWFARRLGRSDLVALELDSLRRGDGEVRDADRFLPLALLWRAGMTDSAAPRPLPLHWRGEGATDVSVHRSAWNDPRATFVGLKGGSPSEPHAHMDVGSFVLEANGVRWAVDLGMQDYHSIESAGISLWQTRDGGDRWKVFRLGADSHNVLRFDGAPQRVKGRAKRLAFHAGGDAPGTALDLSSLYAGQVARVTRAVTLRPDRSVLVRDEWTAGAKPTEVVFQWLTFAEVDVLPDGVRLRQKGETLRIHVNAPSAGSWRATVRDVSAPPRPYDEPNPGLRRIEFSTSTPASASGGFTLQVIPENR